MPLSVLKSHTSISHSNSLLQVHEHGGRSWVGPVILEGIPPPPRREERICAGPQHLATANKLPTNAKSTPMSVLKQVYLRVPGQLQEETHRQKRPGWPSGHCDPSYFQESGAAGLGVEGLRPHPPQITLGKKNLTKL